MTQETEEIERESGKVSLTHPRRRRTAVALILLNHSGYAHQFGMERFYCFEFLFVKWAVEMGIRSVKQQME